MSSQSKKTKTYKRYPATDALKKGSASTIESACVKIQIAQEYVNLRDKYKGLKNEYQKSYVKLEQMEQLKKDNFKLISDSQKKSDTIKKLQITITQLNGDIQLLKDTTNDRGDYQRLEGFLKKKDHEIEELKKQIDSTKINAVTSLENQIHQLKQQNEYLKEGYGKFNLQDESLKQENKKLQEENKEWEINFKEERQEKKQFREENKLLKEGLERLKEEHGELTQKQEHYHKLITEMFDSL
tara:strand:- start:1004 stop:1726 length:723 start_codon:yes stop_codon:yes gene_type:complete